ncbi:hypothetical protein ACQWTT_001099 [Acinetobacter baumannii]
MIFIRMLISAVVVLLFVIYFTYVLVTSDPCTRIDRATKPIELTTELVTAFAKPWAEPETLQSIRNWSARTRLRAAIVFRIQFYSDSVPPVICDWDAVKDRMLGADSSLSEKDDEVKQKKGLRDE